MGVSTHRDVLREVAPGFAVRQALSSFLASRSNWPQLTGIVGEQATLQEFVKAAMAIYVHGYIGVRTIPPTSKEAASETAAEKELKDIFGEVSELLKDDFRMEIEVLEKKVDVELSTLKAKLSKKEEEVEKTITRHLAELSTSPSRTHLIDFLGDLLGISYKFRSEFIKMTYGLKPLSIELEEEVRKPHEEECVEISTHLRVKKELGLVEGGELNIKDLKQLSKNIASQALSHAPKDEGDLKLYAEAYEVKLQLVKTLREYSSKKASLSEFFNKILEKVLSYLKSKAHDDTLLRRAFSSLVGHHVGEEPEVNFEALKMTLSGGGAYSKIMGKLGELGIDKRDLAFLLERCRRLERLRDTLIREVIPRLRGRGYAVHGVNLEIFTLPPDKLSGLDEAVMREIKKYMSIPPPDEFKQLLEDEARLRRILEATGFSEISILRATVEAEMVLEEMVKQIMSKLFFECMGHASRVVELYNRAKKDGERFKMLFKVINDEEDENIRCVKEELLIELLLQRQKEMCEVFPKLNAEKICGFIWARQTNRTLNEALEEIKGTPSPLFLGVAGAKLNLGSMPPVSYSAAYDLSQRYLEFNRMQLEVVQEAREKEAEAKEIAKREIYERIDPTGLLERKITIALRAPTGIEKAELEWSEKDTRKLEAMSKIFIGSEIGKTVCPYCARVVKGNSCPEHGYVEPITEGPLEALAKFYFLSLKIIEELTERKSRELGKKIEFRDALRVVRSIFSELRVRGKISPKSTEKNVMEGDMDRYLIPAVAKEIAEAYMKALGQIRKLK
ncbi:MAG: hypothetical protein QXI20_02735 [Candidatus Jordarchaeales archaeon]